MRSDVIMSKNKILIVDDAAANRELLCGYIEALGHTPLVAENGLAALQLMQTDAPDLVLLDILMPEMDGCELLRRMKHDPELRHLPVVMISALDDMDSIVQCIQQGADDYLVKPFNATLLRARVSACLEKKELRDAEQRHQKELEEANARIESQNAELLESNALKDKFLQIASHDIRNPLAVIISCEHLIMNAKKKGILDDDKLTEYCRMMKSSANTMLAIVNDFLDYRKIHSGQLQLMPERLDINRLLGYMLKENEPVALEKQLTLEDDLDPSLPMVKADGNRTRQVIGNFLGNAMKFSPNASRVLLRTRLLDGKVRAEIHDSGPGVKPEERDMLFKEFARISNRPTGGEKSTGLGLSIVKRLVEAQGGSVGADFPETGGSIFWFELPVFTYQ